MSELVAVKSEAAQAFDDNRIAKMRAHIEITAGLVVTMDAGDVDRVQVNRWRVITRKNGTFQIVTTMRSGNGRRFIQALARAILNPPNGTIVVQLDKSDPSNFCRANLVAVDMSVRQGTLNKRKVASSSRYRGVSKSRKNQKWRASIQIGGRSIHLGMFDDPGDAARAYSSAAREYFGETAFQNEIA